ncbi:cytochrome c biogenesis protein [Nibricoccus sp. IMCC34717]|uniref:cytochrome c biogenesis protein n=1 Tax=Nibricoccus sp. IMCC34717 TaxID=3034021 RepID=UPI00384A60BA
MKRFLPLLVAVAALIGIALSLRETPAVRGFNVDEFGRLPVLSNGRIKPLDTVARTTLLQIQGRQTVYREDGSELGPQEWLLDTAFRAEAADSYRTFLIDDPEVLALIGQTEDTVRRDYTGARKVLAALGFLPSRHRRFSFDQMRPYLAEVEKQARLADSVEANARNRFQRAVTSLYHNLITYQGIKYSFVPPDSPDFLREIAELPGRLPAAAEALRAKEAGKPHDDAAIQAVLASQFRFESMSQSGSLLVIPPPPGHAETEWAKAGDALMRVFSTAEVPPAILTYAGVALTWRENKPTEFNEVVHLYRQAMETRYNAALGKATIESHFNFAAPFYRASVLFLGTFLIGILSWLRWPEVARRSAFWLCGIAWTLTTAGIATRMWLEARPPVTNLYSSALFVGWVGVALCLVLEWRFRNAIALVAAGAIGFCALIIAHNLSLSGDTLEMMRAVLDSNFWLATHVVTITIGYGATFLAGFLAILYVVLGVFTRILDRNATDAIRRMVYGIVCFATLFSLVGTVLGGIWADQSWGRFWGWDPKENGALLIVLWNAIILHARWGGLVRGPGLMALAIFGNCVTAWSWFGTNMLGVGLHSYGFMDAAFVWLVAFEILMFALIGLACIPTRLWRGREAI